MPSNFRQISWAHQYNEIRWFRDTTDQFNNVARGMEALNSPTLQSFKYVLTKLKFGKAKLVIGINKMMVCFSAILKC